MSGLSRRQWLAGAAAGAVGLASGSLRAADAIPPFGPSRVVPGFTGPAITTSSRSGADNRYLLSNQVDFEHRSPTADDVIRVGMVDLVDGNHWAELGENRPWGWQQGCMLQWRPGHASEVRGTTASTASSSATFST